MAGKEPKERVVNVQEGDGEVIDLGLFDFKEKTEEGETKQLKQKPEVLVTVIKKINLKNEEEETLELFYNSNDDEDDEIEEEGEIEKTNEKKDKRYDVQSKNEGDVGKMVDEEKDTNVEIERVMIEETIMWQETIKGSQRERNEKKGFLKKIIERWT